MRTLDDGRGRPSYKCAADPDVGRPAAGVKQVWIADPEFETITVYRENSPPVLVSNDEDLTAVPELPGFRCQVKQLFRGKRKIG